MISGSSRRYKVPEFTRSVLGVRNKSDILLDASLRKAVDVSLDISITRSYVDLEFLTSRWSTEKHTFNTFWEELHQLWRIVMFRLPILADEGAMVLGLGEREKEKLKILNATLRISSKSTYTPWARYW